MVLCAFSFRLPGLRSSRKQEDSLKETKAQNTKTRARDVCKKKTRNLLEKQWYTTVHFYV